MDILKNIIEKLHGDVTEASFEGANIVLYTDNEKFFKDGEGKIKEIVNEIKKRIELRADQKILCTKEEAEKDIRKIVPEDAEITNIIFDFHRSIVIIEAKKPGMVIGKQGSILEEVRRAWDEFDRGQYKTYSVSEFMKKFDVMRKGKGSHAGKGSKSA